MIRIAALLVGLLLTGAAAQISAAPAKFISQLIPENIRAGQSYTIAIQFKNTGRSTWRKARLTAKRSRDARRWGVSSRGIDLDDSISPGQLATFQFQIRAPAQAGSYGMRWQLVDRNNRALGTSPQIQIRVAKSDIQQNAEFIHQTLPGLNKLGAYYSIMERNHVYPVTLTFKNNGTTPWQAGKVSLVSKNPDRNLQWSVSHIDLQGKPVQPGEIKAFSFKIITPPGPGIYHFQWQLFEKGHGWLGESSENVAITVR